MKVVKILLKAILLIVALVVVAVLALPLWIGPVATGVANSVTPGITGTGFHLNKFALNPYTGVLRIGDMELQNPTNYSEKTAVKLDSLTVDVAPLSLASDLIHVEDITLDGLFVYVSGLTGGNFQDIAKHASGGDKKAAPDEAQPTVAEEKASAEAPTASEQQPAAEKKASKKVVIDRLMLKNIKLKIGMMPAIPVPGTITLTDLGKPKDANAKPGVTFKELWQTIVAQVMAAVGATGDGLKFLGGLTADGAKALGGLTADGAKALGGLTADGAKAVGDGAKAAAGAVGEGAKAAAGAVGDGAKAAAGAVGDGAKAVGDGAKKALDSLKNLW